MTLPQGEATEMTRGRDAWWWATAALGVVVAALLIQLVVLIPTGTSAIWWQSKGQGGSAGSSTQPVGGIGALQSAASAELTAFYSFDYKSINDTIAQVSAGSTGTFKTKFAALAVTLREGAGQLKVTAKGTIRQLAVHEMTGTTATLLAVVDQTLSNSQTRGKTKKTATCAAGSQCSVFHLWATYQVVGGQWKLSELEYLQ